MTNRDRNLWVLVEKTFKSRVDLARPSDRNRAEDKNQNKHESRELSAG